MNATRIITTANCLRPARIPCHHISANAQMVIRFTKTVVKVRAIFFELVSISLFIDINECAENLDICGTSAVCVNKVPSYDCNCKDGFTKNGGECIGNYFFIF